MGKPSSDITFGTHEYSTQVPWSMPSFPIHLKQLHFPGTLPTMDFLDTMTSPEKYIDICKVICILVEHSDFWNKQKTAYVYEGLDFKSYLVPTLCCQVVTLCSKTK
jgi:hypothetical protein